MEAWRLLFSASLPAGNFIIGWIHYLFLGGSKGVPFARSKMSPGRPKMSTFDHPKERPEATGQRSCMTTRQSSSVMSVMHDLGRGLFSRACLLLLELCSSLSASRAMSSSSDAAKIELLREISEGMQYASSKLGNMEQRQCDSDSRGDRRSTDVRAMVVRAPRESVRAGDHLLGQGDYSSLHLASHELWKNLREQGLRVANKNNTHKCRHNDLRKMAKTQQKQDNTMAHPWQRHDIIMSKPWQNNGKFMPKPWQIHVAEPWQKPGKPIKESWQNHGRIAAKPWQNLTKP